MHQQFINSGYEMLHAIIATDFKEQFAPVPQIVPGASNGHPLTLPAGRKGIQNVAIQTQDVSPQSGVVVDQESRAQYHAN